MKKLFQEKLTLILIAVPIILAIGGFFIYRNNSCTGPLAFGGSPLGLGGGCIRTGGDLYADEIELNFDPEGPYALLYPRRDGNALVLNIKRTGSYDAIKYEISYNSEGIDRGASGELNTQEKKGEYEQEILFGSCSTGGKCVFDKGVENGTLTMHIKKGKKAFRMVTLWHLQKPGIALGKLSSGDNHFLYQIDPKAVDLSLINFSIINDLSAAPKLPSDKIIIGKVYGVNAPVAKSIPGGQVTIELADNPPADAKICRFDESLNKWVEFDTVINQNKLSAKLDNSGIITILSSKK